MSQSSGEDSKKQTSETSASGATASSPTDKKSANAKKRSPRKKTARPNASSKKSTSKKSTPKKMTMAEMQSALKSLETRMKRADTLTRKSVKTLEGVVERLDTRTQKDTDSQKSALSRRVGRLSNDLEESLATTRNEIKAALASALANPNPTGVEAAVAQAMSRLDNTETHQAKAIAKVNRHLANLAKAVEDRIVRDQIAAANALGRVEKQLSQKIASIETESAEAVRTIGGKVATLSEAMESRQTRMDASVRKKLSDLAAQTQAEFDRKTNSMEERLKSLEAAEREAALKRPDDLTDKMSANVSALSGQVEKLQARISELDASFAALQTQTDIMGQDLVQTQSELQDAKLQSEKPQGNRFSAGQDPASPPPYISETATQTPRPHAAPSPSRVDNIVKFGPSQAGGGNPYGQSFVQQGGQSGSQEPVEFNPAAYHQDNPYAQPNVPHGLQQSAATAFAAPEFAPEIMPEPEGHSAEDNVEANYSEAYQPALYPQESSADDTFQPDPYQDVEAMPAGDPLLPYADPAYAENDTVPMEAIRIGGNEKPTKRRRKEKKPRTENSLLTPRNLRVAALATGLTLITLFVARSFLSDGPEKTINLQPKTGLSQAGQVVTPDDFGIQAPAIAPDTGSLGAEGELDSPIGEYEDNTAPIILDSEAGTLESAARAGDNVAQFQLGLSYLEQNRIDDGIELIRNASQTLPAAQYRLAKIYESGIGVEKDTALARELTERAARAGNRIAMHDLAIYYAYGNGDVPVDMGVAAGWFEKAAERGVVDSQFNLAILFENGQGVKPSLPDAYFWYSIAGAQGDQTAAARIDALETQMSEADVNAAKARIESFTPVKIDAAANGVFKDLPWAQKGPSVDAQKKAEIKQVQILLTDLGFDIGPADGIMGDKTRDAILGFQRANDLSETGQLSAALMDSLENASRA